MLQEEQAAECGPGPGRGEGGHPREEELGLVPRVRQLETLHPGQVSCDWSAPGHVTT